MIVIQFQYRRNRISVSLPFLQRQEDEEEEVPGGGTLSGQSAGSNLSIQGEACCWLGGVARGRERVQALLVQRRRQTKESSQGTSSW